MLLKFTMNQNYLEGMLKHRLLGPVPRVPNLIGLGWAWEFVLLTGFQIILTVLA